MLSRVVFGLVSLVFCCVFFFNDTATTEIYTLSLHDALPILKVPTVPYLEMGGSIDFFEELKVPKVTYLEMGGSNVFLYRN